MAKLKQGFTSLVKAWDEFFFTPISPATIGLFRICFGIVIFLSFLGRYPFRELFYSDRGIISRETMSHFFPHYPWLYFQWLPDSEPSLQIYFLAFLIIVALFTVGLWTRVTSVLVFLGLMSFSNRNFFIDNAGDDLMRINSFFVMFSQAGAAFSLDRWFRVRNGKESSQLLPRTPWAQRMLQLQLAYLYLNTFILKLPGEGWQDGTALYYALNYLELRRFSLKYMFYYLWQIKLATYMVMSGEILLATLVWFRKFRYWILPVGFMLHFGINLTMQFPIFQYVMIVSLINFIYPEDVERAFLSFPKILRRQS